MKRLELRIVKFDKLLVVEQLDMKGEFKKSESVMVEGDVFLGKEWINLREGSSYDAVDTRKFSNNAARDEYAEKLIGWITDEQFGGSGKLEIGKPCLVSDDGVDWETRNLLAILPENKDERYIVCLNIEGGGWSTRRFAKPLNGDNPKIVGRIYIWECAE